jgi:hypothetical protein
MALDGLAQAAGPGLGVRGPLAAAVIAQSVPQQIEAGGPLGLIVSGHVDRHQRLVRRRHAHQILDRAGDRADLVLVPGDGLVRRQAAMATVRGVPLGLAVQHHRHRRAAGVAKAGVTAARALGTSDQDVLGGLEVRQVDRRQVTLAGAPFGTDDRLGRLEGHQVEGGAPGDRQG